MPGAEKGLSSEWWVFCAKVRAELFPVGNPDIFHLSRVLEEPAPLGDAAVEPVDDAAFVGPDLLQVSGGHGFGGGNGGFIAVAPDGVNVIVLGKSLEQLRNVAGDDIHGSAGKVARIEKLVKIARD